MGRISYRIWNKILLASIPLIAVCLWTIAVKPAIEASQLYNTLKSESEGSHSLDSSPEYYVNINRRLTSLLQPYKVDSADWSDSFWGNMSSLSLDNNTDVVYESSPVSTLADSIILARKVTFRGDFRGLVTLVDSAERLAGNGYLAHIRLYTERNEMEQSPYINMDLLFLAINEKGKIDRR